MRLYGHITKVTPQDDGTIRVEGIASSEAEDDQGETIRASAMKDALPDYMRFPAIREMHQLSAAGTTIEAEVDDDGFTRIVARVVDPVAISKIKNQVYRGFSIGGRVTKRDPSNPRIITGIQLSEISLVDRPANPQAALECWKASITEGTSDMAGLATLGDLPAGQQLASALTEPVQVWHCGDDAHRHKGKAEAVRCIEKQAAAGANGGTQWEPEPLAKGEPRKPTQNIPEIIPEPVAVAEEAQKAEAVELKAEGAVQPEVEVKEAASGPETPSEAEGETKEAVATEALDENSAEKSEVATAAELPAEEAAEPELPVDPDTSEKTAEPSETEQAIAKAAEVAAIARAALNLPVEVAESAETPAAPAEQTGEADGGTPKGDYGDVEYADPGYQSDGKPRYPLDAPELIRAAWAHQESEGYTAEQLSKIKDKIVGAWKSKIEKSGPPEAGKASLAEIFGVGMLSKGLIGTAGLIETVGELERLGAMLQWQMAHEGGEEFALTAGAVQIGAAALRGLVAAPLLEEIVDEDVRELAAKTAPTAFDSWLKSIVEAGFGEFAEVVEKAARRHSAKNQMLLDKSYECAMQCAALDGCSKAMTNHLDAACKMMRVAGAQGYAATEKAVLSGELGIIGKAGGHRALLDLAHFCLASMGSYCSSQKGAAEESGVQQAHNHLCAAGANCNDGQAMKASEPGEERLAKAEAEKDTLRKSLGDVVSLVERLVEKMAAVDEKVTRIDNQELAPRGLARTAGLGITKAQDNGAPLGTTAGAAPTFRTVEDIVAAVEAMPPSMEKAFLHMRIAQSDPRPVKVVSAAEAGTGAAQ